MVQASGDGQSELTLATSWLPSKRSTELAKVGESSPDFQLPTCGDKLNKNKK